MSRKRISLVLLSVLLIAGMALPSAQATLQREQEGAKFAFDSGESAAYHHPELDGGSGYETGKRSFFGYFWRILVAPFVLLYEYPRNERTDIHDTYVDFVNRGSGREWKPHEVDFTRSETYSQKQNSESSGES